MIVDPSVPPLASSGLLPGAGGFLTALAVAVLAAVALGVGLWLRSRARTLREVRSLVRSIEAVRSGDGFSPAGVAPGSPLALVSDALNRLGDDLDQRLSDARVTGERLSAVMDAAEDTAVITTDLDGDVTSFSRGAAALFGWTEDEVLGRPAAMLFQGESYREFLPKLTRRSMREQGVTTRSTLVRKDGSGFPASLAVRQLAVDRDRRLGFLMVVKDVSEQARLETELRDSERRYRGLIDSLGEGVAIARQGKLVFANPAFAGLYGLQSEALIGRPLHDLVATRDVLLVEDRVAAAERGTGDDEPFHAELVDDRGLPLARVALTASRIEVDGQPAALLLAQDETVRRRIEAELRHNEARLDAVIEAMSDGLLVVSSGHLHGGTVQMSNRAFAEMVGVELRDLLGLSLQDLQAVLARRDPAADALARLLGGDVARGAGATIRLGSESPRELEVRVASLTDRRGHDLGRVLACRDMTARRRAEADLQAFAEKLQLKKTELEQGCKRLESLHADGERRAAELGRLNDELQALNDMKTQLLGNVAHELQTPLVSVRGYTEMILKGRLGAITEEQRKGLGLALKNIDRLIAMIDGLLSFSREQADLGTPTLDRFPLRPLVEEVRDLFRQQLAERRIDFRASLDDRGREVHADRDKIAQVLTNLLSNAIKFNHEGGFVEVTGRVLDDELSVRVRDGGRGIPAAELDRVFERSYRAGDGAREVEGSGIGLSVVRDILRQHGCRIHVESAEGEGATFTFTLPLAADDQGRGDSEPEDGGGERRIVAESDAERARDVEIRIEQPESETPEAGQDESADGDDEPPPRLRIIRNQGND